MREPTVAEFISASLRKSGKSMIDVSREIGLKNPNFLSMVKKGKAKIPLNRMPALARALGIVPQALLFRCLEEYDLGLLDTILYCLPGATLTEEEVETQRAKRKSCGTK